jgi:hypothetical protein
MHSSMMTARRRISIAVLVFLWWCPGTPDAYRVGDSVDTEFFTDIASTPRPVLRNQMPLFGIRSRPQFQLANANNNAPEIKQVTFAFEDGLWALPAVPLTDRKGEQLQTLRVTFVYANGHIKSIMGNPSYGNQGQQRPVGSLKIIYNWVEEEDVHLVAGQAVMYLVVFLAAVFYLVVSCGVFEDDSSPTTRSEEERLSSSSSFENNGAQSEPKWQ